MTVVDVDLLAMSPDELRAECQRLRDGVRALLAALPEAWAPAARPRATAPSPPDLDAHARTCPAVDPSSNFSCCACGHAPR